MLWNNLRIKKQQKKQLNINEIQYNNILIIQWPFKQGFNYLTINLTRCCNKLSSSTQEIRNKNDDVFVDESRIWKQELFFESNRKAETRKKCKYTCDVKNYSLIYNNCYINSLARLSQGLWTTKPKNYYHPNQLSIKCVV